MYCWAALLSGIVRLKLAFALIYSGLEIKINKYMSSGETCIGVVEKSLKMDVGIMDCVRRLRLMK